jgi:hypothetical protein
MLNAWWWEAKKRNERPWREHSVYQEQPSMHSHWFDLSNGSNASSVEAWSTSTTPSLVRKQGETSHTGSVHAYEEAPMRSLCFCANHKLVIIFTSSFLFLYSYCQYRVMDTKINTRFLTFDLGGLGRYSFSLWPWQQTDLSTLHTPERFVMWLLTSEIL